MIRTQISVSDFQASELRRLSTSRRKSQAALMREAIDALLGHDERKRRVERARVPAASYRSGQTDTAERHDDVLSDAFDE